ncbi:tetratricopeptide repeat protein [Planctomicrobium sp. SH661]|uniref:tetratricopeptide repeat protein n=1 Tax=Planctomicrobium sp. SH661 TaxID=3448124 RepID=UPI003F5B5FFD
MKTLRLTVPAWMSERSLTRQLSLFCCLWVTCLLGDVSPAQADPVTDYNVAVEFYKQQRWDLAADSCEDFLKKNPNNDRALTMRLYWAQSLLHLRKFQEAREQFRLFVQQAPQHADRPLAMYRIGECSYFLNDFAAAEAELQLFLKTYPNHELTEWGWVYLGESQLRLKKFDEAAQSFQASITRFPQGKLLVDAEFGLAAALEGAGQKDRALEVYERIAARPNSPRAPEAVFNIAARLFDEQKFDQSAARFQQMANTFPEHRLTGAARLNAGYALYYLSKFPEALAEFERAANDPAQRETANYWIGLSQKSMGQFAQAAATFSASLTAAPQQPLAEKLTFQWADAEYREKHYPKAIELFVSVVQKWPTGELADDALHSACEAALQAGELQRALELNQEFQKSYPESGLAQVQELLSGRIFIAQGDAAGVSTDAGKAAFTQAATLLRHVVETSSVASTQNFARFQLARIAERQGRDADAIAELKPIVDSISNEVSPEQLDAVLLSANSRLRLKDASGAIADYQRFIQLSRNAEEKFAGYAGLLKALVELQKWDSLETTLTEFRQADPENHRFGSAALAAGDAAFDQRQWAPAAVCFQSVIALGPESPQTLPALSGLGHAEFERKNFTAAAQAFGQLADTAKDPVLASHAAYMQGLSLQQAGDLKGAMSRYQQAGEKFSQNGKSLPLEPDAAETGKNAYRSNKGAARVARELNEIAVADQLYDAAYKELKTQPADDQVEMDLLINEWADLSYNAKNYDRSDELYRLLIQERPDSPLADDAGLILAESLRFGGKKEEAIEAFRRLADNPKSDEFVQQRSLTHLLDLYAEARKWPEVVEVAGQFESRFPGSPQALYAGYRSGEGQLHLQKYGEAVAMLQRVREALSKNLPAAPPWWPEAWLMLAEAQFWQKDYAKMEETIADLQAKSPNSPLFYRADAIRGRALENQARFPEARAAYVRVVDSEGGRGTETAAEAQFRIAESYLKENNLPVALREYYKVYAGYDAPKYESAALYQAGACDISMKHFPQAAETFRKLIAEFPDSEFVERAQARLKEIEAATGKQ